MAWGSEAQTQAFAEALAGKLRASATAANALIALHGDLGAGKTTLARHLLKALGVTGRVKSPTYAVVEPYSVADPAAADGVLSIWHFDFFRFNDPDEWEEAGFRDIFASPGLKLAEWPDKAAGCVPPADLLIQLEVQDDEARQVTLTAQTKLGASLLHQLADSAPGETSP
jgi:tRNA threonylcarbamoyladenosine biosynthesis protein TsaE